MDFHPWWCRRRRQGARPEVWPNTGETPVPRSMGILPMQMSKLQMPLHRGEAWEL